MKQSREVEERIDQMLQDGRLDSEQAMFLILASQRELLAAITETQQSISRLQEYQLRWPSIPYLIVHRPKLMIAASLAILLFYTFFIHPLSIETMGASLLKLLGL